MFEVATLYGPFCPYWYFASFLLDKADEIGLFMANTLI